MTCAGFRNRLIETLEPSVPSDLSLHLATCEHCSTEAKALSRVWRAIDLPAEPPIAAIEQTLRAVRARRRKGGAIALGAGLAGAVTAMGTLAVRGLLESTSVLGIVVLAAAWVLLFGGLAVLALKRSAQAPLLAIAALGALLALAGQCFCPLRIVGGVLRGLLGPATPLPFILFLAGAAYSLVPSALVAVALGAGVRGRPLRQGLIAGAAFMAALLPSILNGCRPFALGMLLAEIAGSLLGAVAGATGGLALRGLHGSTPVAGRQ